MMTAAADDDNDSHHLQVVQLRQPAPSYDEESASAESGLSDKENNKSSSEREQLVRRNNEYNKGPLDAVLDTALQWYKKSCVDPCLLYTEQQVAYECRQQQEHGMFYSRLNSTMAAATQAGASSMNSLLEQPQVELYKQFLFDEESVIHSVRSRQQDEEEEED